jgi:hypothetical protein
MPAANCSGVDGELGRTLRDLQRKHFQPPSGQEVSVARHSYY